MSIVAGKELRGSHGGIDSYFPTEELYVRLVLELESRDVPSSSRDLSSRGGHAR